MKKSLFAAVIALLAIACSPDNIETPTTPDNKAPAGITLSDTSFRLPAEGGAATLVVTGPFKPKLLGVPGWLDVSEGEFADYLITYTLKADANEITEEKTAEISIASGPYKASFTVSQEAGEEQPDPVLADIDEHLTNPNASAQTVKVYDFLRTVNGKKILSGVQSGDTANNNDRVNQIYALTGRHPALAGYDFIFLQYSPTPASWSWKVDYGDISAAKEQWTAGGLVSYMWHWNVPTSQTAWENGKKGNFDGYNFYCDKTSFSIGRALTEGTWENEFILGDIEKVAGYLKLLKDQGIPVIWRPLHEAAGNYDIYGRNGAWFWWGREGAEPCKKLWKLLRDKLEGEYGLDNLIWVWTLDVTQGAEKQFADWYPGNDLVDIVGVDIYADDTDAKQRQYDAAVALSGGHKMVTVSECGNIPEPAKCISADQHWSWFLTWDLESYPLNTEQYWKSLMTSPAVTTREGMPSLK